MQGIDTKKTIVHQAKKILRLSIYISTIFISLILLGFKPLINPVIITGHLKTNLKDNSTYFDNLLVFVKGDGKILAKSFTDSKGDFQITFTPNAEKSFDFYCTGLGIDTLLIASVTTFESDILEMTFYIPGKLNRNVFGRVVCPICRRTNNVYKIRYGDAPVFIFKTSKSGDTTYSPIYKGKYQASCLREPATYYCDRDKVKF